jgi:hypothetical protein
MQPEIVREGPLEGPGVGGQRPMTKYSKFADPGVGEADGSSGSNDGSRASSGIDSEQWGAASCGS